MVIDVGRGYMDLNYNVLGVVKSQICSVIANSENVREALDFSGENCKYDYDKDDPMTLMYNCIIPWLQNPDVIETTDPVILVGVELRYNNQNPYLYNANVTIECVADKDHLKTNKCYVRQDLLDKGDIVCYTRVDWLADEIIKCISNLKGTWIGDVQLISSPEGAMSITRYTRNINLKLEDVNIGKIIQDG